MRKLLLVLLAVMLNIIGADAQSLLVGMSEGGSYIRTFDILSSGNVTPVRSKTIYSPQGIAVYGKEIYVNTGNGCYVYSASSTNGAALRSFSSSVSLSSQGVAVDANYIYLSDFNGNRVCVFNRTSAGVVAPVRTISGSNTHISNPVPITIDDNNIYVRNYTGSLLVFDKTANGNVAPIREISGANTQLTGAGSWHIAVNATHIFLVVSTDKILVFDKTANGNVAPIREISGTNTLIQSPRGIAVDANYIYQFNAVWAGTSSISVFNLTDNGNVAPQRTISGSNTLLKFGYGSLVLYSSPTTITTSISNIQSTSVESGGVISTTVGITTRGVCWNTSGSPTYSLATKTSETGTFASGAFSAAVSGLSAGVTYYVRAYAVDTDGDITYGNEITFTTIPTLGEWGLIAFGGLIALIGGVVVWRKLA